MESRKDHEEGPPAKEENVMRNSRKEVGKYIGTFTARGQKTENETEQEGPHRIRLFDGVFDTAYVVREFYVFSSNYATGTAPDVLGKLATSPNVPDTPSNFFDASDGREIAWGGASASTDSGFNAQPTSVVDPENLVIEDLWFYARGTADTSKVNYLIVMDKYDITETLGAVSMAKDRARDSSPEWRTP